jgi:DNA replication protein DnaC
LEDIDYGADRTMDKKTIQTLSSCAYIEQKLNIVITGKTGNGKSFLACAFGNTLVEKGIQLNIIGFPSSSLKSRTPKTIINIQNS